MTTALAKNAEGFLAWWARELVAIVPPRFLSAMIRDGVQVIRAEAEGVYRLENAANSARTASGDAAFICGILSAESSGNNVVLRLENSNVLLHSLEIPAPAMGRINDILALEMENATPFSGDEAIFDFIAENEDARGMRRIKQVIVKNELVIGLVEQFRREGVTIARVDAEGAEGINLLPRHMRMRRRMPVRREHVLLVCALAALAASTVYRQDRAMRALELQRQALAAETEAVRAAAAEANAAAANSQALQELSTANPSVLGALASLTDALGDNVWLTELSIAGRDVSISGNAASASQALAAVEASADFASAEFSSTVFTDQTSKSERFSARFRIDTSARPNSGGVRTE